MKALLYIFIFLAIASTVSAQRSKSALLSSDEAEKVAKQCSRPSPKEFSDTWRPSTEQIKKMEGRLSDISKLRVKSCCIIGATVEDPENWYLQYAALVWKGKKIIYINAVSRKEPERGPCAGKDGLIYDEHCESWKHQAWIVCDGGNSWGVVYDVAAAKFSELAVNGIG